MEGEVRWGIIGTGKIAHDFATAIKVVPNTRVVAVGSRSDESAEEFAQEFDIPKSYGAYDLLLKDPEVDVVYIATPHSEHRDCTMLALDHKKNVLCEKPLAINADEVQEMITLAKNQNVFLMEGHWTRFFPVFRRIRELISSGTIGDVMCINADHGFVNDPPTERLQNPELAGGSLLDLGVYPIEIISMLFGIKELRNPSQLEVIAHISENQVDDLLAGVIKYGPSELGIFSSSINAHMGGTLKISGTKGRIEVGFPFWAPSSLTMEIRDSDRITEDYPLPKNDGSFNFRNSEGLAYEIEAVNNCILNGKTESPDVPLEESLIIMSTLDAIRERIGLQFPKEL